jgi:hypothetical protein
MSRELARTLQASQPGAPVTAVPVTVTAIGTHTVTVLLPGGTTVTAPRSAGATYTVSGAAWALIAQPAVIAVFPTA